MLALLFNKDFVNWFDYKLTELVGESARLEYWVEHTDVLKYWSKNIENKS